MKKMVLFSIVATLMLHAETINSDEKSSSFKYETIKSPTTGKIWLDRNLGASQACKSFSDDKCYGDYYQWGRGADGHEKSTSATTKTISKTPTPNNGGKFILGNLKYEYNWINPKNDDLWQGAKGINNPCPSGYRVPSASELKAEKIADAKDGFNKLKLPLSGSRREGTGDVIDGGKYGYLWTNKSNGGDIRIFFLSQESIGLYSSTRANGMPIRCIKD